MISFRPTRSFVQPLAATGLLLGAALALPCAASAQTGDAAATAPAQPGTNAAAQAQGQNPEQMQAQSGPRYAFAPVAGGALKLDTVTGRVSLCAKGTSGFTCEAVPDSRDAYEAEIARLQKEVAALKSAQGSNAGTGTAPDATAELDQALDYMERIYRRFKSMIDGLNGTGTDQKI